MASPVTCGCDLFNGDKAEDFRRHALDKNESEGKGEGEVWGFGESG